MDHSVLSDNCLFCGLFSNQIEELLRDIPYTVQIYEKDETIFQPLETAKRIGVILRGSVQSYKLFPNGNQIDVTVRKFGDIIGLAAVLSVQGKYPFGVAALEHTEMLMFHRDSFLRLIRKDSRLAENALSEISSITFMLQQRMELLSYHGIDQKIAFYLLMASIESDKSTISIPGTMTKWAMMMNVSRPSLYRELKKMDEQNLLRFTPPKIQILNFPALKRLLCK
jgi:CRP-like cAMP-binding protein